MPTQCRTRSRSSAASCWRILFIRYGFEQGRRPSRAPSATSPRRDCRCRPSSRRLPPCVELGGGILLAIGLLTRLGGAGAGRLLRSLTAFLFHAFWALPAAQQMGEQLSFCKDLALAGGLLVVAGFGAGAVSLDAPTPRLSSPAPAGAVGAWYSAPMDVAMRALAVLPWLDWVALALFFPAWAGYAIFAKRRVGKQPSLLATTNRVRRQWMLQTTYREVRVVDGVVIQNLSTSPSFFASTTILIIGGLLAVLGTADKASELVREMPFAARTSALVFDLKLLLLLAIFVYAFFRFTWSMRQYTFGALLVAAAPEAKVFAEQNLSREAFADRPAASSAWRPRPSTTACAATTSPSPRSAGSSRRSPSWRRPSASSTSSTSASSAPRCWACSPSPERGGSGVARQAHAAELPLRVGREEVAVAGADVARRRGARAAAQHELVAHELAVVFADRACERAKAAGRAGRPTAVHSQTSPNICTGSSPIGAICGIGWKTPRSAKLPLGGARSDRAACSHSSSVGSRAPAQRAKASASK